MPGHYKLGVYHDSSKWLDLYQNNHGGSAAATGLPFKIYRGKNGGYSLADQVVYQVPGAPDRGLMLFGGASVASQNDNFMPVYFFGGLVYTGAIPGRENDTIGFSASFGRVGNALARTQRVRGLAPQTSETLFELNYGIHVTKWFRFMPDLQFIARPGGTGTIPNAFVIGLQTNINF